MLNIEPRMGGHEFSAAPSEYYKSACWQVQDGGPFVCDGAQSAGQEPSLTKACFKHTVWCGA